MEERNYIFIANSIDKKLKGFSLGGWEVKTIHKKPLENELQGQMGESLFKALEQAEKHPATFLSGYQQIDYIDDNIFNNKELIQDCIEKNNLDKIQNPYYVYLEKRTNEIWEITSVISTLRLFKTSLIGLSYPLSYDSSCKIVSEVTFGYPSSLFEIGDIEYFNLDEQEKIAIKKLYEKVLLQSQNPIIQTMLKFFNASYNVMDNNISFIMRVTILEMLINGNSEMTYKLSRSVAVLLGKDDDIGKDEDKSSYIFNKCKKIYASRSKYLHEGQIKNITSEIHFLALDYSRRVIANLIDIFSQNTLGIDQIRETLDYAGFDTNPFNVKF